jgi:hypothetical protein
MKKKLLLLPFLFLFSSICFAQVDISLEINNDKVKITPVPVNGTITQDFSDKNLINIDNNTANKIMLSFIGKNTQNNYSKTIPIQEKTKQINLDAVLKEKLDKRKMLPMLIIIQIKDSENKILKTENITVVSKSVTLFHNDDEKDNITDEPKAIGRPYYDVYGLLREDKTGLRKEILQYYNEKNSSKDESIIIDAYRDNPFLNDSVKQWMSIEIAGKHSLIPIDFKNLENSSLGGLDVTNFADGLAKFLVSRTKEELNVAFFSKFKDILEDPKYADFKVLFPASYELLDAIGDEIYNYNRYLINLREAFKTDIKVIDENFPGIIPNHKEFFDENFEYAVALKSASYITTSVKSKMHPGDIIAKYDLDNLKKDPQDNEYYCKNLSGAIQTLQLISESIRDTAETDPRYWVSFDQLKKLVNDKEAFRIFLGLVYQKAKTEDNGIEFENGKSFIQQMDLLAENYEEYYPAYKNYILNFAKKTDAVTNLIKNYSKPANDSIAVETYAIYIKNTIDLISYATEISDLPYFRDFLTIEKVEFKKYAKVIDKTADLAIDLNRSNYSSAINNTITIYNLVRTNPLEKTTIAAKEKTKKQKERKKDRAIKQYNKSISTLAEQTGMDRDEVKNELVKESVFTVEVHKKIDEITNQQAQEDSLNNAKELISKLAQYGTFMANVSTAKNSDDVKVAIEAVALPSGSSRIKRESQFNVSLNAYVGLFTGYEAIKGVKDTFELNSYGLTAPVGIAVSYSPQLGNKHWSYSLFASIIDIGAVAAFRFKDIDVAQVPSIQLKDIVSPGIFLSVGIPRSPISLNLGVQTGPNLRNVYVDDPNNPEQQINKYQDNVYVRYSASIVVDIPVLNFYTKSK